MRTSLRWGDRGVLTAHVVLAALLCSLPHWVALFENRGDYSPFAVSPSVSSLTFDETHAYAPPARRFMVTGKIRAEADNYQRRSMSAGTPFVPPVILGFMGRLLGSLERAFIAADCLFPAALFLLLYAMTGSLVGQRQLRLLVAWSSLLVPFGLLNAFWLGDDALLAPLEITRTPQPEISFFVLIGAAILLARAIRSEFRWPLILAAGIASGAVVYCYYFYALAWGITLGLLFFFGFWWQQRPLFLRTAIVLLLMVMTAIPYAVAALRGKSQGGQTYLLERMGAYTHRPDLLPLAGALLVTLAIFAFGKEFYRTQPVYFVLAVLVAGALYGMNFQVLSGYETQRWHFWKRLALPVCFFLLASAAAWLAEQSARIGKTTLSTIAKVVLLVLLLNTAARLICAGISVAPFERATNPRVALLTWVRSHLPADQVIGTVDPQLILLIPALTADYTYVPSGLRSLTSTLEIVERYDQLACFLGLSPEEVARQAAVPNHLGHSTELLQVLGLSYTGDSAVYSWFVHQYRTSHCTPPKWQLDYLVVPASWRASEVERHFPYATVFYKNSAYALFDVEAHAARETR